MTATAPMSTKRAQTQDRLMDAATALFAEKGVLAASVEEICERAGFTRERSIPTSNPRTNSCSPSCSASVRRS